MKATADAPVVLLVEDETRVLESSSPKEALHLASKHEGRLDLLLTDVVMPGMTGIDLADKLRDLQPDLITIFMSGYAEGDVLHKISATASLHIQKPFTVNFLLSRVAEALSGAQPTNT